MLEGGNSGGLEDVESVTGFVQCGHYIILHADRIGEDEWFADGCEGGAKRAGGLVFAVRQVGQSFRQHDIEIAAQNRVHFVEDGCDALLEFIYG